MKRNIIFLIGLLFIVIMTGCSKDDSIEKQIMDAQILDEPIVWFEEIEDRVVVFTKGSEGIRGNLLKKVNENWSFEGIGPAVNLKGESKIDWIYINLNKIDFPIIYGITSDNQIHKIRIANLKKEAVMVDLGEEKKLWYVLMNGEEAKKFLLNPSDNIISISKSGEILYRGKEKIKKQVEEAVYEEPKLKIPFKLGDIFSVSIHKDNEKILITENKGEYEKTIFLQGISSITEEAKAEISSIEEKEEDVYYIRFNLQDKCYEYKYYYDSNVIIIDGVGYHPYSSVYMTMCTILEPDSVIGDIYRLLRESNKEQIQEDIQIDDSFRYHFERLCIDGKGYEMWMRELLNYTKISSIPFLEMCEEKIDYIEIYEEGIIKLDRCVVFTNDSYKTIDGISIGTTIEEVVEKLGEPNLKTKTKWSYYTGDYMNFHLLIEDGRVKYIMETIPC